MIAMMMIITDNCGIIPDPVENHKRNYPIRAWFAHHSGHDDDNTVADDDHNGHGDDDDGAADDGHCIDINYTRPPPSSHCQKYSIDQQSSSRMKNFLVRNM